MYADLMFCFMPGTQARKWAGTGHEVIAWSTHAAHMLHCYHILMRNGS